MQIAIASFVPFPGNTVDIISAVLIQRESICSKMVSVIFAIDHRLKPTALRWDIPIHRRTTNITIDTMEKTNGLKGYVNELPPGLPLPDFKVMIESVSDDLKVMDQGKPLRKSQTKSQGAFNESQNPFIAPYIHDGASMGPALSSFLLSCR